MKKKYIKKLGAAFLAICMVLSVAGCGGKNSSTTQSTKIDKEHIYSIADLEFEQKFDDIYSITYQNDYLYVISVTYGDTQIYRLNSCKIDGSDFKSVILAGSDGVIPQEPAVSDESTDTQEDADTEDSEEGGTIQPRVAATEEATAAATADVVVEEDPGAYTYDYSNMGNFVFDSKGNIYATEEKTHEESDEQGNYTSTSQNNLLCWNSSGELSWSKDIREGMPADEYFYVQSMNMDSSDQLWLQQNGKLVIYDLEGNKVKEAEISEDDNGAIYRDRNGDFFTVGWNTDYTKQIYRYVDKNTMQLGEGKDIPSSLYNYSMFQGIGYDLFLSAGTALYGYNMGDEEPVKIMDYIDSDLESNNLSYITGINDTQFAACYNDTETWEYHVAVFTKVDPKDVVDKKALTFGCFYLNSDVKTQIVKYNKSNAEYRIQIKDYSIYSTSEDYLAGYTKLNNDILAGSMPDIIQIDQSMPMESYIAKGLLADLNPYIDADEELSREDYLPNILEAFSRGGKLYRLVPQFSVDTVIGASKQVGDTPGWTLQELEEVMKDKPEGTAIFSETTRDYLLYNALMFSRVDYIDDETGKCNFDSEGFVHLLEFVSQFPKEIDYSIYDDDSYWESYETMYREGKTMLMSTGLYQYGDINRIKKATFGEDITLKGFPTESRNGSSISVDLSFAISAKSANRDGAWDFLRYYLTDEYQDKITYSFPVKISALEKRGAEAMERPYWLNEDGTKEYYDDTYTLNGVDVTITPMTQEEVDAFTEFLKTLNHVTVYDNSLSDILTEEAAAYFDGQKSAEEVAKIIQSRVKIYISENR